MCNCENIEKAKELGMVENMAKRMAKAEAKKTGTTVVYIIYLCENGNPDFMDENTWQQAVADGKNYTFIKYISSI